MTCEIKVGDRIKSRRTGNEFVIEHISSDGWCFIVKYTTIIGERSQCYTRKEIARSFTFA